MQIPGGFLFESPEWLKGLWALPLIVVFYLFRKRARRLIVPFLPFWERVFAEKKRRPTFLRTLLSILLQMLAAAAILVALAHPYKDETRPVPVSSVVIVDRSLGTRMTVDGSPLSDLAAARGREVATRAVAEGPVAVAILRDGLEPRGSASNAAGVAKLFEGLPPALGRGSLQDVATLRRASSPETRIFLVTPFDAEPRDSGGATVLSAGKAPAENGGIRSVTHAPAESQLVVRADPGGIDRTLRLVGEDGSDLGALPVPAAQKGEIRMQVPPMASRDLVLRLEPADGFPEDDTAALTLPERGKLRIVLVSDVPTPALDSALVASSVMDTANSGRVALKELPQVAESFDVAIVVGAPPDTVLPPGRYVLVDTIPRGAPLTVKGSVGEARATKKAGGVPWLNALDVEEWRIHKMASFEAGAGFDVLVDGTRGPLVGRFEQPGVRAVVLTVQPDVATTTLPLLPAFPLMLRGALLELAPRASGTGPVVYRAGGRIVLSAAEAAAFAREGGAETPLVLAKDGGGYQLPEEAGRFVSGSRRIATAWLDHPALPRAGRAADDAWPKSPRKSERRSFQGEVLLILLAVLLAEWCSYHFGSTD